MASFLSKLFNSSKRDTTYTGAQPYASLTQAQGGADSLAELKRRMAGVGVGYGSDYENQAANPIITNMRGLYNSRTMPELVSELSATGRRRGSGGFEQLRQSLQDQGNQEGDVYARAYQANQEQKRNEINQALSDTQDFARSDADLQNRAAQFSYADHMKQVNQENQRTANQATGMQNLVAAGADIFSQMAGGGSNIFSAQPKQTGQMLFSGAGSYPITAPPAGYNYQYQKPQGGMLQSLRKALSGGYR